MSLLRKSYFGVFVVLLGCEPHGKTERLVQQSQIEKNTPTATMRIPNPYRIEITGSDYRWHVRYPGSDGELNTADDVTSDRDVHLPVGTDVVMQLKSTDYVYLLSLPEFRLKEIAVPTLDFQLAFHTSEVGEFALDGDEFCGDSHPELKGRLFVETRLQFEDWIRQCPKISPD